MNSVLSKKVKLLSFVAMIMVLFIHSFNYTLFLDANYHNNFSFLFIETYISFHICRVAVPSFFIVSAYLLMYNYQFTIHSYIDKLKSRFKSLFIPYVLWITIWTFFLIVISSIPLLNKFINNPLELDKSIFYNLTNIFNNPVCYQFWFIRDLMFLVVLSPLLYFLVQKMGLVIVVLGFLNLTFTLIKVPIFQSISLFYFIVGMAIYCNKMKFILLFFKVNIWILGLIWSVGSFVPRITIFNYKNIEFFSPFFVLLGVVFIWRLYDKMNHENLIFKQLERHSKYSFFLFASHEPLMISFKKAGFCILGVSNEVRLELYFIVPILTYIVGIFVGYNFNKYFYNAYNLLTGGR